MNSNLSQNGQMARIEKIAAADFQMWPGPKYSAKKKQQQYILYGKVTSRLHRMTQKINFGESLTRR
jgi:hypothetical protein